MTRRRTRKPLPWAWRNLADRFGGVRALAEACGVSERTIYYWASGRSPSGSARLILEGFGFEIPKEKA